MPFSIEEYVELRPFLYHVTARENLPRLRRTRTLQPARTLLEHAGRLDWLRLRRAHSLPAVVEGETVVLKDQRPLIEANIQFEGGWSVADLVEYLNSHVFFWPGDARGPITAGARLLDHYAPEAPAVLRLRLQSLLSANPGLQPLFCPYNSGAPRQNKGLGVPRGPGLFRPGRACPRRRHEVVEVGFRSAVVLPTDTQLAVGPDCWESLIAPAT
jgi:hypothetical protein